MRMNPMFAPKELEQRLVDTIKWAEENAQSGHNTPLDETRVITDTAELMKPLQLMYKSLVSQGRQEIADGLLTDTVVG